MTLLYGLAVTLMIAVPLLLAVALRRRFRTLWLLWTAGALAFFLSQVYHLPLNRWLADIGLIGPLTAGDPNLLRTAAVLGLSAGLCEGLMRILVFWFLDRRRLVEQWQDAVMIGLGHGGLESMILGALTALSVSSLLGLEGTDLATLGLTADQTTALATQLDALATQPLLAVLPFIERMLTIVLHVAVSLAVWLAFRRRNALYAVAGILYHALVDATLVYVGQFVENPWLMEGVVALLALPAAAWIVWTYRQEGEFQPARRLRPLRDEWRQWATLLRKELREQWRTRRVLVVFVVFLLFGLTAPLLARFTPELVRSIPGAEQFADLIPEPTPRDAVGQYVESITQFGFILTLLLTMGSIAGEKERGTAALVLSKPVPRWAFVAAKFGALGIVYLAAVLLAGSGAWYYTNLLFEQDLPPGAFLAANLLLWLWLLAFVAAGVLGSAIARTTLIAAGLGLLGGVVLFAGGAFPQAAGLLPTGLVGWVAQLGGTEAVAPLNWGAIAGTIVVILFCLVTAVGVVERQEI
jgi:ABC-2 type transport system permease protein